MAKEKKGNSKSRSSGKKTKASSTKKRKSFSLKNLTWTNVAYSGLAGFTIFASYCLLLFMLTPSVGDLMSESSDRPSRIMSADGVELASLRRSDKHWVSLADVSPYVIDALISTEDHRFFQHNGVDVKRTLSSIYHTAIGDRQGGSTIPQQLARVAYPKRVGRSISINRKLKEVVTAIKIETSFSKQEILEIYLNYIPFIYQATGIEMGARTYFNKSASELNLLESATLVGVLKGTSYYNPKRHPDRARSRRNIVLAQMAKHGRLDTDLLELLQARPLRLNFRRQSIFTSQASHFVRRVQQDAMEWAEVNGLDLYRDGLLIQTTLDSRLQEYANQSSRKWMPALQAVVDVEWSAKKNTFLSTKTTPYQKKAEKVEGFAHFWDKKASLLDRLIKQTDRYRSGSGPKEARLAELKTDESFVDSLKIAASRLQMGFVAIDPHSGQVKAWVGSRNYRTDQYDHVAMAKRQVGSIFKPFVYAAALRKGYQPYHQYENGGIRREFRFARAGDGRDDEVTLAKALAKSNNEVTKYLMDDVGPSSAATLAKRMGIRDSELREVQSLALGTSEASLLEMVSSYSTIANRGEYVRPYWIRSISSSAGEVLFEQRGEREQVLNEDISDQLTDMMRGVVDFGTASDVRNRFGLTQDFAGKTGTTQNNADGWFIQMHPNLVAGSWIGFNEPSIHFRSDYWGSGGHNALRVVADFYKFSFAGNAIKSGRFNNPDIFIEDRNGERRGLRRFFRKVFGSDREQVDQRSLRRVRTDSRAENRISAEIAKRVLSREIQNIKRKIERSGSFELEDLESSLKRLQSDLEDLNSEVERRSRRYN